MTILLATTIAITADLVRAAFVDFAATRADIDENTRAALVDEAAELGEEL